MSEQRSHRDKIEGIFELHFTIGNLFFKGFDDVYERPEGLNATHMRAVMMLRFHGPITMTALSHLLNLEKGSFTTVAARLVKSGVAVKEQSDQDKRVFTISLSEKGRALAKNFQNNHWVYVNSLLDRLSPEEREEYYMLVERQNQLNAKMKEKTR